MAVAASDVHRVTAITVEDGLHRRSCTCGWVSRHYRLKDDGPETETRNHIRRVNTRIEIYSGPDSHDRYRYSLHWPTNYIPGHPDGEFGDHERGQMFRARLPDPMPDSVIDHRQPAPIPVRPPTSDGDTT